MSEPEEIGSAADRKFSFSLRRLVIATTLGVIPFAIFCRFELPGICSGVLAGGGLFALTLIGDRGTAVKFVEFFIMMVFGVVLGAFFSVGSPHHPATQWEYAFPHVFGAALFWILACVGFRLITIPLWREP